MNLMEGNARVKPLIVALCLAAAMLPTTSAARENAARIVAVVNRGIISESELEARIVKVQDNLKRQKIAAPEPAILRQQVLERLVIERLQQDYAKSTGLKIDDSMLEKALGRIAEQNHMNLDQLREALAKDGMNFADFREQIRNEILFSRLRDREVDSRVSVSEAEVDAYLKNHPQTDNQEYQVAHILISLPEDASTAVRQEKQQKAEQALAALQHGEDFAAVAARFSEAKDALEGGDLGWRNAARLPDLFLQTVTSLKPGTTSGILKSPAGFHILKLAATRGGAGPQIITKTHARHILIKTGETVSEAEARQRIDTVYERLQHGGQFEELARVYSEDGSAGSGGDLGWLSPGDTVPDFEQAMDALKPGALSPPVKSPFGWHLIQVVERKSEDVGPERERMQARQQLKSRRADEQFDEWLQELRDNAYVDIRL